MAAATEEERGVVDVVVCGGGIVGCASAYFLTKKGFKPLVVERCEVACAASGKAGGFLAREWGSGAKEALHHQGFDLHAQLAEELKLESFRRLPTLSVSSGGRGGRRRSRGEAERFPWVDKAGSSMQDEGTAQVNPKELTTRLMEAAEANGASLLIGSVEGVRQEGGNATAVIVDGKAIACKAVVFAMGPWSVLVEQWLPEVRVPMQGILSTSLVFRLPASVEPPCVLFCEEDEHGCHLEVSPRVDSSVYVCGCGGSSYLDNAGIAALPPEKVVPNPARVKAATAALQSKTSVTGDAEPEAGACIRPCPPDASPMIGKVLDNAILACGHNCWGILWGPITGQIVADLVTGVQPSVRVGPFDPSRFYTRREKRGRHMKEDPIGEQW